MDVTATEVLEALLPYRLPAAVLILAFMFRKPIGAVLERLVRVSAKRGDAELTLESPTSQVAIDAGSTRRMEVAPLPDPPTLAPAPQLGPGVEGPPPAPLTPENAMIIAALDSDRPALIEAYARGTATDVTEEGTVRLELLKDRLLAQHFHETDALERIERRAEDEGYAFGARVALGLLARNMGSHERAARELEAALAHAKSPRDRIDTVERLSESLSELGDFDRAHRFLVDELQVGRSRSERRRIYLAMAAVVKKRGGPKGLLVASLLAAFDEGPNLPDDLFSSAFAAAESQLEGLSAVLYEDLLAINPDNDPAQNNLGVQYQTLNLR